MDSRDSIEIKLGLNSSALRAGLGKVRGYFTGLKNDLTGSGGFGGVGGILGGVFSAATLNRVAEYADKLQNLSQVTGVTVEHLQGLSRLANINGSSADTFARSASILADKIGSNDAAFAKWGIKLEKGNGELKTTDEILFEIADKLKGMSLATDKAAMATDLLGKSGRALIPTLDGGSKAIQDFTNSLSLLSAEEIKAVADAKDQIQALSDRSITWLGKLIAKLGEGARYWGAFWARAMQGGENVFTDAHLAGMADAHNDEPADNKAGKAVKTASQLLEIEKKRLDTIAKIKNEEAAYQRVAGVASSLRRTKEDRSLFTLQELINMPQFRGPLGFDQIRARNVNMLRQQGEWYRTHGMFDASQASFNKADSITKQIGALVSGERNPFELQEKAIDVAMQQLDELKEANKGTLK